MHGIIMKIDKSSINNFLQGDFSLVSDNAGLYSNLKKMALATALVGSMLAGASFSGNVHAQSLDSHMNNISATVQIQEKTFDDMSSSEFKNNVKPQLEEGVKSFIKTYQDAGFYKNINLEDITVKASKGTYKTEAGYETKIVHVDYDKNSTLSKPYLRDPMLDLPNIDKSQSNTIDYNLTMLHEFAHLNFSQNHIVTGNKDIDDFIYSEISFSKDDKSTNQSMQFFHENYSDVYSSLAYMKVNNFSDLSRNAAVDSLIKVRVADFEKNTLEHGDFFDSHDSTNSLKKLKILMEDEKTSEMIKKMNPEQLDKLSRQIVYSSYVDYVNQDGVKDNIRNSAILDETNSATYNNFLLNHSIKIDAKSISSILNENEINKNIEPELKNNVFKNILDMRDKFLKKSSESKIKLN